jgi:HEAT repeat protein
LTDEPRPADAPARKRSLIGWTAAILLFLALAWFAGSCALPTWSTHRAVTACGKAKSSPEKAVAKLGGPERARVLAGRYLRLPEWTGRDGRNAAMVLAACGPGGLDELLAMLSSGRPDVRGHAVLAVSFCDVRDPRVVPALLAAAKDPDEEVRAKDCWALYKVAPRAPETVPALIECLGDANAEVRWTAVMALGSHDGAAYAAVEPLTARLKDTDFRVRGSSAEALGNILLAAKIGGAQPGRKDEKALEALRRAAFDDEHGEVRKKARWAYRNATGLYPKPFTE